MLTGRLGDPGRVDPQQDSQLPTQATRKARSQQESYTARLAKFFPQASPVRIPVRLTRAGNKGPECSESTIIEFGTPREVLFASSLPLEFADMLHLENSDGTLDADVSVVALQYMPGRTAVAARFTRELANWIVKS